MKTVWNKNYPHKDENSATWKGNENLVCSTKGGNFHNLLQSFPFDVKFNFRAENEMINDRPRIISSFLSFLVKLCEAFPKQKSSAQGSCLCLSPIEKRPPLLTPPTFGLN